MIDGVFVVIPVTQSTYDEILERMDDMGYDSEEHITERGYINMQGLALCVQLDEGVGNDGSN